MTELDDTLVLLERLGIDVRPIRRKVERNRLLGRRDRWGTIGPVRAAVVEARRQHRRDLLELKQVLKEKGMRADLVGLAEACPTEMHFRVEVHVLLDRLKRGAYLMEQDGKHRLFDPVPD